MNKIRHQSFIKPSLYLIIFSFLTSCAVDSSDVDSGFFIDSPVKGLMFESGSIIGRTDSEGRFYHEGNQLVTFSIDGVVIGQTSPAENIFPFDLFTSNLFVSDTKVNNMSRFLQSLDNDGNPDNGIVIEESTRNEVVALFGTSTSIDFSTSSFQSITSTNIVKTYGLRSAIAARTHLLTSLADYNRLEVDLITLGDGFTAGMQSAEIDFRNISSSTVNLHQHTQVKGYATVMEKELRNVLGSNLTWGSPLLAMDEFRNKTIISDVLHYNIAIPGATTDSFINYTAGSGNEIADQILSPVFNNLSALPAKRSQLEAAKLLASQTGHEQKLKVFTLWIGMNDVLGAVTASKGSELTTISINTFLSGAGHDLTSVMNNISTTVSELSSIKDSYLFIATIPDVTKTGALFYKEDIDSLSAFTLPDTTALTTYSSAISGDIVAIGFSGFTGVATYMNISSDNTTLDSAINALPDPLTLSWDEAEVIKTRVNEINSYINSFADPATYPNVFVVDLYQLYEDVADGQYEVDSTGTELRRGYGGGFFSMDGIYPSNYGYALIAKEFLKRLAAPYTISNESNPAFATYTAFVNNNRISADKGIGLKVNAENINLSEIWNSDPYRDNDGDGFPDGPGSIIFLNGTSIPSHDPSLLLMKDCNDSNSNSLPQVISGISCN